MSSPAPSKLAWPPRKEDLERLYLGERLSASKIAKAYGLRYKNPKVAESTILYHLKRNGIKRRDAVALSTKFSEATVDDWVRRYQAGESLKEIAGGKLSPVTVYLRLRKRRVGLRDKVDAQIRSVTKYQKTSFKGSALERAYLIGFRFGDLHVVRHGRAIRVRVSTTHPAMIDLFRSLFSAYGPVYQYPKESELTSYEWSLDCDLDPTFGFLLNPHDELDEILSSRELFLAFLAGFFDTEGSVYYHKKKVYGGFELSLTNSDQGLLQQIADKLAAEGFSPKLRQDRQASSRGVTNGGEYIFRLSLWRFNQVNRILKMLPLKHREKLAKRDIVASLAYRAKSPERQALVQLWEETKARIKEERDLCIKEAERAFCDGGAGTEYCENCFFL